MMRWLPPFKCISKWAVLLLALLAGNVQAESPQVSFLPVPEWVHETAWSMATNSPDDIKSAGTRCLLYECQDRPKKTEEFVRVVELMENENGVQNAGSLRVEFEAEFQELCLHSVIIHRDGKTINCLNASKVRVIQPENELEGDVFTGRKTMILFLEDLRVGDVLEYAYSLRGANPILDGHYWNHFTIQSGSSVDREVFRVVWDDKTALYRHLHLTDVQPIVQPWKGGTEYVWDFSDRAVVAYEDYQPANWEPYPYVEVSDFADWGQVVNWALPLYDTGSTNIPPDLAEMISGWQQSAKSNEEKARFALEFVQDKLRYTGIELGPDSYRPAAPVETFQKRYGDCKGKVVLLRFLLRQMGIESWPALVNSSVHEAIESRLPSPFAFNHVILQLEIDGKIYWVDPTCSHQGGLLGDRYLPPYGKALVIRPNNDALEDVPLSRPENAFRRDVISTFDIRRYDLPVHFSVRTEYRGGSADYMRQEIAGRARNVLADNYLNYYAKLYSGIIGQPWKVTDNRLANLLIVEESYTITNLWKRDAAANLWKTSFYAENLYDVLTDPGTRLRKTPIALTYPLHRHQQIVVHMPDPDWQIPELQTNIENANFSFRYHRQFRGATATYEYDLTTRRAAVPVEEVAGYLADHDRFNDLLTDTLQRPTGKSKSSTSINWLMVILAFFVAGAMTAGCIWYWRQANSNQPMMPPPLIEAPKLQGLGGWLVLVGIGLCVAPIVRIVSIGQHWESYFSLQIWELVTMPTSASYHPLYGPLLIYEVFSNIIMFGLNLFTLCLFFKKHRAFPKVFIALALCNALFLILDHIGGGMIPSIYSSKNHAKGQSDVIRALFYAVIWISYMLKSRRVKATFVK
jgi:hypothetical protein